MLRSRYLLVVLLGALLLFPCFAAGEEKDNSEEQPQPPAKVCIIQWGVREKGGEGEFMPYLQTDKEVEIGITARIENMPLGELVDTLKQTGLDIKLTDQVDKEQLTNLDTKGRFVTLREFRIRMRSSNNLSFLQQEDGSLVVDLPPSLKKLFERTPQEFLSALKPLTQYCPAWGLLLGCERESDGGQKGVRRCSLK